MDNISSQAQQHQQQQAIQHFELPNDDVPWSWKAMPCVMQFSAIPELDAAQKRALLHQKRKSDLSMVTPPKQFITEERISAEFNGMHISNNFGAGTSNAEPLLVPNDNNLDFQITARELSERLKNANRITICEEISKFQQQHQINASILPEVLFNRIERPCTALVLWQPPPQTLETLIVHSVQNNSNVQNNPNYNEQVAVALPDEEQDELIDNNNTSRLDFNILRTERMDEDI